MIIVLFLVIAIFSFFLIKSTDFVVLSLKALGSSVPRGAFAVTAIVLALGTSLPELFVGVTSALEHSSQLSLGVVIGSNIANTSLVAGVAGVSAGRIKIRGTFLERDVWIALISGLAPIILIYDGGLSRGDGIVLLAMYGAYATSFFRGRFVEVGLHQGGDVVVGKFLRRFNNIPQGIKRDAARLGVGIFFMLVSADVIVRVAKLFALSLGIPVFVVGLIIVAIGTSLPELVFSIRSLKSHESGMFFGNILGSTIANSTLVIGLTAMIAPVGAGSNGSYTMAALTFMLVSLLFWLFARTKHRIDWWESGILVIIYLAFVLVEFIG
jgi:cation:H+ antiporter